MNSDTGIGRRFYSLLLIAALLLSQWAGLRHEYAHSYDQRAIWVSAWMSAPASPDAATHRTDRSSAAEMSALATDSSPPDAKHSCLLFDALTLSAVLQSPFYVVATYTATCGPHAGIDPSSRHAAFLSHFDSRAPPSI